MLLSLHIRNYAIIEDLTIDFKGGLTVITGETGAGKSIIVGALSLLTGQRSDKDFLLDKQRKCIVEAVFDTRKLNLKDFFNSNNLDFSDNPILRREITTDGRSRAFINDTPVNLAILKELCSELIDIHSQHETLLVGEKDFQLGVIDAFAGHDESLEEYSITYKNWFRDVHKLNALKAEESRLNKEKDFHIYQVNELEESQLASGEMEQLESESEILLHSGEIKSSLKNMVELLNGDDDNLISHLSSARNSLTQAARYHKSLSELVARINSVLIELKDISGDLGIISDSVEDDPGRLELISGRLDHINRLLRKHNVKTVEELIALKNSLQSKISSITSLSQEIILLTGRVDEEEKKLKLLASKISEGRTSAMPRMAESVHKILRQLGMPNARITVQHHLLPSGIFNKDGIDNIRFMFLPNKGGEFKDLSKVASGGEMSRLMLGIKASVARGLRIPILILDEVDSGVSGEVAGKVAAILKEMSKTAQLITITHLPQIAAKGDTHYFIYKKSDAKITRTFMKPLEGDERILEIAKMLSGEQLTDAAISNARVLFS